MRDLQVEATSPGAKEAGDDGSDTEIDSRTFQSIITLIHLITVFLVLEDNN